MNKSKSVKEEGCRKSLRSGSTNGGTALPSRCRFCDEALKDKKTKQSIGKDDMMCKTTCFWRE